MQQPYDDVEDRDQISEETPEDNIPVTELGSPADQLIGFFEVEKIILTRALIPTIERLKSQFAEAGGSVRDVRFAQNATDVDPFGHELRAIVSLTLKKATPASEIVIKMHNFGETNYVFINDIRVSDGVETVSIPNFIPTSIGRDVGTSTNPAENRYGMERKWLFPLRNVTKITVEFLQSNPYPLRYTMAMFSAVMPNTDDRILPHIGLLTDVSCREVFMELVRRYEGEIMDKRELAARLMAFIPELLDIYLFTPRMDLLPEFAGVNRPADRFSPDESIGRQDGIVTIPREESNRWRYAIGISDISIGTRKYSVASEFVSQRYNLNSAKMVSIEADIFIPDVFPPGEWLKFFVSLDDGISWHRICPINLSAPETIPKTIYVNSEVPEVIKEKNPAGRAAYIDTNERVKSIRLKVELHRPEDPEFASLSPVVHSYKLRIVR